MSYLRKTGIVSLFIAAWAAATILALTLGLTLNWPDFIHVDYGAPLNWATHTLSTIAGPADTWTVNVTSLMWNLIFWLGIMTIAVSLLQYALNRKTSKTNTV